MKILLNYTLKNLRKQIVKSLVILLTLILSCAFLYIALSINYDSIIDVNKAVNRRLDNYDIMIYSDGENPSEYKDLPEYDSILSFRTDYVEYNDNKYVIYSGNVKSIFNTHLLNIEKSTDQAFKRNVYQFFTTENNAIINNLKLGDKIEVLGESFTLTAYVEDLKAFDINMPDTLEIFIPNDISDILGYSLTNNTAVIDIDDTLVNSSIDELISSHPDAVISSLCNTHISSTFKSLEIIMVFIVLIVLLLSSFVIYSLETVMIENRLDELITFRTIGTTSKNVSLILGLEGIVYSIISIIIGIPLGYAGYNYSRTINGLSTRPINLLMAIIAALIIILLSLGIIFITIYNKTHNKTIKELIFPRPEEIKTPRLAQLIIGISLIGFALLIYSFNQRLNIILLIAQFFIALFGGIIIINPICYYASKGLSKIIIKFKNNKNNNTLGSIWLGLKNIERTKTNKKIAISITVLLSLVLVIFFSTIAFKSFFTDYADVYPYDILIKNGDDMGYDYSFINDIDGVDHYIVEYYDIKHSIVNDQEIKIKHLDIDYYCGGISYKGEKPTLNTNEVIVGEILAQKYGYKIGDSLHLEHDACGEKKEFDVIIKGFCDGSINYSSGNVILYNHDFYLEYVEDCPSIVGVYLTKNTNIENAITILDFEITKQTGSDHSVWDSIDYQNDDLNQAIDNISLLGILPIYILIIAIIGLLDSEMLIFNQRKKEYAVLSSICMSRKKISIMVISELILIFIIGGLVGFSLGVWLTFITRDIMASLSLYVHLYIDYKSILVSILLLFLLLLSTSVIPIIKLRKMEITKEIQYE